MYGMGLFLLRMLWPVLVGAALAVPVVNWYWKAKIADIQEEYKAVVDEHEAAIAAARADTDRANMALAQAAHRYEEWKSRQGARVEVVTREVVRVVRENPEWGGARLPDGVRNLANAAAADIGAVEPKPALPGLPATADRNKR